MTDGAVLPTRSASVRVPGSTSNLGGGFDCLGLAIDRFIDVSYEPGADPLAVLRSDGTVLAGDDYVAISFAGGLARHGLAARGTLRVRSGIPIGCGLGSSAAAFVAGSALAELVATGALDPRAAFAPAMEEEGHGDNAGASAYGGLIAVVGEHAAPRVVPLELSSTVGFAFAAPPTRLSTRAARAALPATVPHGVAVGALSRLGALLLGLAKGDAELLASGFRDDLHVPYRLPLIPGGEEAIAAAVEAGAWAGTVSGAGSGLLAVCPPGEAPRIAAAMAASLARRHDARGVVSFPLRAVARGASAFEADRGDGATAGAG